ncbi:MAG: sugar/nucleoside kinase (ribokinase family) [Saprospiraceae bacterium]|jgi:sugar/nucleoside kinase (ribokinase family)
MDFICIGHACHDTAPSGYIPGGAVTYAGLFAKRLQLDTGILTSFGADYLFKKLFHGIHLHTIPSSQTTLFQNKYIEGKREQHLLARADNIQITDLPDEWKKAKMVLIGPIANEVDFDFLDAFQDAIVCINLQGWMRRWDAAGKVFYKSFDNYKLLAKADITIISEEDVGMDYRIISDMAAVLKILVVTKGDQGCDIYFKNKKNDFPAFPTEVIDSTGAGDTFSTAFLVYYYKTGDLNKAAQYANVAASFCIEALGIEGLPNREQMEERYKEYIIKNS